MHADEAFRPCRDCAYILSSSQLTAQYVICTIGMFSHGNGRRMAWRRCEKWVFQSGLAYGWLTSKRLLVGEATHPGNPQCRRRRQHAPAWLDQMYAWQTIRFGSPVWSPRGAGCRERQAMRSRAGGVGEGDFERARRILFPVLDRAKRHVNVQSTLIGSRGDGLPGWGS